MKLLVIGGSGYVGGLTLPILARHHTIRVFDLVPPPEGPWDYMAGDVADADALQQASQGIEALIYMAMGFEDPDRSFTSQRAETTCFAVNVRGLHRALNIAQQAGCRQAVVTGTMSVYHEVLEGRFIADESVPVDARDLYGFSKGLGEEVCHFAARKWNMDINVLRLCLPESMERWHQRDLELHRASLAGADVAHSINAALTYRDGCQIFMISGDRKHRHMNLSKARNLLGWEPMRRPTTVLRTKLRPYLRRGRSLLGA